MWCLHPAKTKNVIKEDGLASKHKSIFTLALHGGSEQCTQIHQLDGPAFKHKPLVLNIKIYLCCYKIKYIMLLV